MLKRLKANNTDNHVNDLEKGSVLLFDDLSFPLLESEKFLLNATYADPKAKNIYYVGRQDKLGGFQQLTTEQQLILKRMLQRFVDFSTKLIVKTLPYYQENLLLGRTSFRPLQISNRKTSYRKDDKRLHVDAFPSSPNQGKRILRVFANVNPHGEARVWRLGEPFEKVAQRFLPQIKAPLFGFASLLKSLRITKSLRTAYDHYMLHMHDTMKGDEHYQKHADQQEVHFAPETTWIVQTDHVSHAAMSGQYLLEQTFYLQVEHMQNPEYSPLRVLEEMVGKRLV